MLEGVPLTIGGGEAEHSAEMERMRNFFMFRGQEGWLTANAGIATTLVTPGAGIRIMPGPFIVNSRFPGGEQQAYMTRVLSAHTVDTTTNVNSTIRRDLVVANIEDPYPSDGVVWPYPGAIGTASRREGPYWNIRIIEDVPANTFSLGDLPTDRPERDWTALPICRIDRPANTSVITIDMIKHLRSVVNPWSGIQLPKEILDNITLLNDTVSEIGEYIEGGGNQHVPAAPQYRSFTVGHAAPAMDYINPGAVNTTTAWTNFPTTPHLSVLIPPWATHVEVDMMIYSLYHETWYVGGDPDVQGDAAVTIGTWRPSSTPFQVETDGNYARTNVFGFGFWAIPQNMRGKVFPVYTQARLSRTSAFNGRIMADIGTGSLVKLLFSERS